MKWCYNLHCVGNKSEIFQLKKDSVEMFSAYMQEVNLKDVIIFNLFHLLFCFGPHVCIGNSSFRICGVVPCRGSARNIILLHTYHTSSTLHWQLYAPHAIRAWHRNEPRKTNVCWVLFQCTDQRYCFQYVFLMGIDNLYMIFPYSVKERVTKTEIFQQFF